MPSFTIERAFCSINHPNGGPGESDLEDPNDVEHSAELARKMRVLKLRADAREGLTKIDMEKIMGKYHDDEMPEFFKNDDDVVYRFPDEEDPDKEKVGTRFVTPFVTVSQSGGDA